MPAIQLSGITVNAAPPVLSSLSVSVVSGGTISVSVSTDVGNGTLRYLVSANASETDAAIKAGTSRAVTVSGVQNFNVSGLSAGDFYFHIIQVDENANDSNSLTSSQFTLAGGGDSTPPVITITGANPVTLNVGDTYTEQGATWTDNIDGSGNARRWSSCQYGSSGYVFSHL